MKEIKNFNEVQESTGEFSRPNAGGYICKIVKVEDVPNNEKTGKGDYLKVEFDIYLGEFKGYFQETFDKFGFWSGNFIRSYKEKALGMFKHFINCVEESNPKYKWDWNEQGLVGKYIGVILGEEEYINKNGEKKVRIYVSDVKRGKEIKDNDFVVPELKKLKFDEPKEQGIVNDSVFDVADDDELPF